MRWIAVAAGVLLVASGPHLRPCADLLEDLGELLDSDALLGGAQVVVATK